MKQILTSHASENDAAAEKVSLWLQKKTLVWRVGSVSVNNFLSESDLNAVSCNRQVI